VAEASCRYVFPARYDEDLVVHTAITRATARLVRFGYQVKSAESAKILATGSTTHVFCGRDMRPRKLPSKYWSVFGV
jgi:acyl-CoA thioester hydrolase